MDILFLLVPVVLVAGAYLKPVTANSFREAPVQVTATQTSACPCSARS